MDRRALTGAAIDVEIKEVLAASTERMAVL
jgi:hypothetical protein